MALDGASFGDLVAALAGRPLARDEPLAVAVSGGPDSLALLLLAHAGFGHRVRALTVDHRLRPDSAIEAHAVAALCAVRAIPHATLAWTGGKPAANLQAAARAARYRLMGEWCRVHGVAWLATAHHADDQAETLLMRLARGAGSGGLAGIRAVRALTGGVTLLRPLLAVGKADLAALVAAAGLTAADDPSNADPRFDRTRARAVLRREPWLDPRRLAAAAAHLADAEAALAWTADVAWEGRAVVTQLLKTDAVTPANEDGPSITLDTVGLPTELTRRLAARAISRLVPTRALPGPDLARFVADLAAGKAATLAGVAACGGPLWTFRRAAPRRRTAATRDCATP